MNWLRFGCLSLAAVTAVLVGSIAAHAEQDNLRPDGCKTLDEDFRKVEFPAGARVELLLAAGNTIPADRQSSYAEMAKAVLACAGPGTRIELLPITDTGLGRAPAFSAFVPTPPPHNSNPLRLQLERDEFVKSGAAVIDSVVARTRTYGGFDPLGTLHAAGDSLHSAPSSSKFLVIMIGNGWQQTKTANIFRYNENPARHADDVIRKLHADGTLPNLSATEVIIVGIAPGEPRLKMGSAEIAGLCNFWRAVVAAAGGTIRPGNCASVLRGFTVPF